MVQANDDVGEKRQCSLRFQQDLSALNLGEDKKGGVRIDVTTPGGRTPRPSRIGGGTGVLIADVRSPHGRDHRILYDRMRNVFEFQLVGDPKKHAIVYRLDELLCVRRTSVKIHRGVPDPDTINNQTIPSDPILFFYFVFKKDKHKWRLKELPVRFENRAERDHWLHILTATIKSIRSRPSNVIVFINPFGGKGKAKQIFEKKVRGLFDMSPGLRYEVIMTERANHARDYITEMAPERWQCIDGLISVGGDGLFNELLSGALMRTQEEQGRDINNPDSARLVTPHIRFGIIGAGSANSIVSTVHETDDYTTAAVHIAIGSECNVDVCTVHKDKSLLRISANAISYGWLGDVLRDSERYRCLGPIRYQWSALRTTIRHPIYKGRVCFSLSHKETMDPRTTLPDCVRPCSLCESHSHSSSNSDSPKYDYHWHAEFTHVICCVIPTVTPFTPHGLAPFTGIGDGTLDLALVPRISRCHNIQFMRKVAMYGGKGLHLDDSLNVYRVVRWSFQPDSDQLEPGVWNLDGEILEQPADKALHFRLHPQLISFFGRDAAQILPSKRSLIKRKRKSSIIYK